MGNAKSRQVAERALAAERAAAALLTPERALVVLGVVGCGTLAVQCLCLCFVVPSF